MTTIRDVARLAGVGVATASRVISGNGSFSVDVAARVSAAIEELGFRPSNVARALSLQSTGTIGVYVPSFKGPFYGPMLDAIDHELRSKGRHMLAVNGYGDEGVRQQALNGAQFLIDRQCDGIILTANGLRDSDVTQLHRRHPRLAVVNREIKGLKSHCFSVDHRHAGRLAARELLSNGHRQLAIISGLQTLDNRQRLQGFFAEMEAHGLDPEGATVVESDFTAEGGWAATGDLLARKVRFTGLFCANDLMAMAAMSCLHDAGKSVPGDVSVVGYDDAEVSAFLSPRLTSVHIAINEMGLNACRLLQNLCYNTELPVSYDFVPVLMSRESVRKIRR